MKKRSEITKIVRSVVATDFTKKKDARLHFGISINAMTVLLAGGIPPKSVLAYIGYERVDVLRTVGTCKKTTSLAVLKKVKAKELEFEKKCDVAEFFDLSPAHYRTAHRTGKPSKTMLDWAGVFKTDEYKKV